MGRLPDGIHLVERDQVRATRQRGAVFFELAANLLVIAPQLVLIAGGCIDHVDQHAGPIDMTKKLQSKSCALVSAFDQAGQVRHDEGGVFGELDHTEDRLERREGVVRDLWSGGAGSGEKGRLAGVGQPDQADIGDQSQLEPEPPRLSRLAQLCKPGGLPG